MLSSPDVVRAEDVTVLIPVRNGLPFVSVAIESALGQSAHGLRVLVSDNDSSDGTADVVERYSESGGLKLVRQPRFLSMIEHFNACKGLVETKYYMMLCHDDFLYSRDAIQKALYIVNRNRDVSSIYSDMSYVDVVGNKIAERKFGRVGVFDPEEITKRSMLSMRNQYGIPLLVRTDAARSLSYDAELTYIADIEFSHQVAKNGKAYHIPELLIANRYHAQNSSRGLHRTVLRQMLDLRAKLNLPIDRRERLVMQLNAYSVAAQKTLFFKYLQGRETVRRAVAVAK